MTIADRAFSNVLGLDRELNVVQPESDPAITSSRTARASREVQSNAQQREAARARALRRRHQKLNDPINIAKNISNLRLYL